MKTIKIRFNDNRVALTFHYDTLEFEYDYLTVRVISDGGFTDHRFYSKDVKSFVCW